MLIYYFFVGNGYSHYFPSLFQERVYIMAEANDESQHTDSLRSLQDIRRIKATTV